MADTDIAELGIVPEIKALELCILGYVQFCQSVAEAIQMRKSRIGAEIKFGQGARTAHKVLELLVLRQVKTAKAFKYYAYGKTSYGYDYTYKATNNNLVVKVNYNFKTNKYEFNVIGKKAGTVKLTLIWNVNDKKTDSATFTLNVDKNGNVTNMDDVHSPSMRG